MRFKLSRENGWRSSWYYLSCSGVELLVIVLDLEGREVSGTNVYMSNSRVFVWSNVQKQQLEESLSCKRCIIGGKKVKHFMHPFGTCKRYGTHCLYCPFALPTQFVSPSYIYYHFGLKPKKMEKLNFYLHLISSKYKSICIQLRSINMKFFAHMDMQNAKWVLLEI